MLPVPWTPIATKATIQINVSCICFLPQHTLEQGRSGTPHFIETVHDDGRSDSRCLGKASCWGVDKHITDSGLRSLQTGIRGWKGRYGIDISSSHLMWMQAARYGLDWHKEVVVVYGCLVGLTKQEAQRQFLTLLNKKAFGEPPCRLPVRNENYRFRSWTDQLFSKVVNHEGVVAGYWGIEFKLSYESHLCNAMTSPLRSHILIRMRRTSLSEINTQSSFALCDVVWINWMTYALHSHAKDHNTHVSCKFTTLPSLEIFKVCIKALSFDWMQTMKMCWDM